jgi:hypothetical protein
MAEALKTIDEYHDGFTRAQLKGHVPKHVIDTLTVEELMQRGWKAYAQQVEREKRLNSKLE